MNNDGVLEFIYILLKGARDQWTIVENYKEKTLKLTNVAYLLNQILRQISVPADHYLISVKAQELWNKITDENMANHHYNTKVKCKNKMLPIQLNSYNGASSTPTVITLSAGSTFRYREIFHDDHIIPISKILHKLTWIDLSDKEKAFDEIVNVLDMIYICRMLKDEDRSIYNRVSRPRNIIHIVEKQYKDRSTGSRIEIVDWENIKRGFPKIVLEPVDE